MEKKLTNCSFLLQITVLERDPKPIKFFVETQMSEEDKQKGVQQLVDSQVKKFVVRIEYFFKVIIFLYLMTLFLYRKHITFDCMRDTIILRPIQNLIQIYGQRLDLLVDPIAIKFTVSPTQRPWIYGWVVVSRSLEPHNSNRAINHQSSRRSYENRLKLRLPNLGLRRPN